MLRWTTTHAVIALAGVALLAGAASADIRLKAVVGPTAKPPVNRAKSTPTAAASVTTPLGTAAVSAATPSSAGATAPLAAASASVGGTQVSTALNQLTVGDLIGGFQQFVSGLVPAALGLPAQVGLSNQQQLQVEYLQGQLDRGEIDENAFASGVQNAVGDAAPNTAFGGFGFFGGPFIGNDILNLADALNLTEAQWQQVLDVVVRLHADIDQLRQTAHQQILAVLTPEQQAQLSALDSAQSVTAASGQAATATTGQAAGVATSGQSVTAAPSASTLQPKANAAAKLQNRRAATGNQGLRTGTATNAQTSAQPAQTASAGSPLDPLQLSDAQQTAIDQIRANLRAAVQARHQQARDEFLAILTPDQQTLLASIEQSPSATGAAVPDDQP